MFWALVRFELRYQLRQPLLWGAAALFAILAFVATATDAVAIGGAIGSLHRNAPYVVVRLLGSLSLIGAFGVVAFIATAALRDVDHGTADVIHATPIRPRDLLLGRFAGALVATCGSFAAAVVGLVAGSLVPWIDPARLGSFDARSYAFGLLLIAFPSFAVLGAICFAVATRVRRIAAVYAAFVGLLVVYFVAVALLGDLERQPLAARIDPFGLAAFELDVRYWTVAEKNTRIPSFAGALLWNRLAWLAAAAGVLAWAVATYEPERVSRRRPVTQADASPAPSVVTPRYVPTPAPAPSAATLWAQLVSRCRLESRLVLRSLPFLLILAFGLINVLANMGQLDVMLGTPVWPVTYLMLLAVRAGYAFLLVLIVGYYAGEAVWRERGLDIDGIVDALPVPTWVLVAAKLMALWAAAAVFLVAGVVGLAGFQLSTGYTRLEPWLYVRGLLVELVPFLLTAVLALGLQAIVNQKFAGYLLFVLYLVSLAALGALHFDHYLYRFASLPPAPYSDLNGWGPYPAPLFWFSLYWTCVSGVLLCLARALWARGSDTRWRLRWRAARRRLAGPTGWAAAASLAAAVATGGYIFWNTNVVNAYVPSDEAQRRQAEYERRYRPHRARPQPRVAAVRADVAIHPRERRAEIRGTYTLVNRSDAAIDELHVAIAPRLTVHRLDLPPHETVLDDRRLGYAIHRLATPIAPGQTIPFGFHLALDTAGFVNSGPDHAVAGNGSFIHTGSFPTIGYQDWRELDDPALRRTHGLPPPVRQASIDDLAARRFNGVARDADWTTFEATLSTDADQIAIAPGVLLREWSDGGRRFFHYRTEAPVPKFFAIQSGRYAVHRDRWQDVEIEVFHHPTHTYNVDRMVAAAKATLEYLTAQVGPYQHRHLRIVEFPRYARVAGAFPGTIPFSESLGFIARLRDPSAIDYPFMVTAHEVAHQWWGHQVLGADVQGSAMLSESLAQYSAFMVMRQAYGPAALRRILRYELDRYLRGRGGELLGERPLALVENQPYIHYAKGGLAFYALQEAMGEARLNDALRRYVAAVRFQGPPYTVSRDLLAFVAEAAPAESRGLLEDLFERITLFDARATDAVAHRLADGRYDVTVRAAVRKLRADGTGAETEVAPDDVIDVGIFGADTGSGPTRGPRVLYMEKHRVTGPDLTVTATVSERPVRAGVDPWHALIDRVPADNVRDVVVR